MTTATVTGTLDNSQGDEAADAVLDGAIIASAAAGASASISTTMRLGSELKVKEGEDATISGNGALDNTAGASAVKIARQQGRTVLEVYATVAAGATGSFSFSGVPSGQKVMLSAA